MFTRSIEIKNVKYIEIINESNLKYKSLEDNLYCKLNDIYFNVDCIEIIEEAELFNAIITNNINFMERTPNFEYSNILNNKLFLNKIIKFLKKLSIDDFYFDNYDNLILLKYIDLSEYISYNLWYDDLKNLIMNLEDKMNILD